MIEGSNHTSSLLYNVKLLPTHFNLSNGQASQNYSYYNDGRLSFVQNTMDANFDRSYSFDHAARLTQAKSGGQARGDSGATPYSEYFDYDAFSNLTTRQTNNWDQDVLWDGATYTNNRRSGWGYDANGNNTTLGSRSYSFDASGQMRSMSGQQWVINHYVNVTQTMGYDGDGEKLKEAVNGQATYYLKSSVLGGAIIEELNSSGQKTVGYVYAGSQLLARQSVAGSNSYITWKRSSPAGTGQHDYNVGYVFGSGTPQRVELDPLGASVPLEYTPPPEVQSEGDVGQIGGIFDSRWSNFFDLSGGCTAEGVSASCRDAASALNNLGVMRPNLIQVTINITYRNGDRRTMQFVTTSNVIRSGFNHTFRGDAAVAAAGAWNDVLRGGGGLDNALLDSITAGRRAELLALLMRHFTGPQKRPTLPCDHLLPTNIVRGESVRGNIAITEEQVAKLEEMAEEINNMIRRAGERGYVSAHDIGGMVDNWFESMVGNQQPWDYKWRDRQGAAEGNSIYEDFGNFNYGATGAAAGYSLSVLQHMAGWVQQTANEGTKPLTKLQARLGIGGTYPYGDQLKDAKQIERGFQYYNCVKANQ